LINLFTENFLQLIIEIEFIIKEREGGEIVRIAIIGAGAMGCRYGASLQKAGAEVWLYDVWKEHINKINECGLTIHDGKKTENIKVNAASEIEKIPKPDVVMIFTKSIHTEDALVNALRIMDNKVIVLTLQNGIGNIETVRKYINNENIIAGTTNYASDLIGPGEIEAKGSGLTKMMPLGEYARSAAVEINDLLNNGGIITKLGNDIMVDVWEKVAFNVALNTLTALTFLTVSDLGKTPEGFEMAKTLASEVIAVANKIGIQASTDKVHHTIESVFNPEMSGDHKTSLLQDRLSKKKTEIEAICGSVIAEAEKNDMKVPHIETVYKLIKIIEKNYNNQLI